MVEALGTGRAGGTPVPAERNFVERNSPAELDFSVRRKRERIENPAAIAPYRPARYWYGEIDSPAADLLAAMYASQSASSSQSGFVDMGSSGDDSGEFSRGADSGGFGGGDSGGGDSGGGASSDY
jgi:hypothetical protein